MIGVNMNMNLEDYIIAYINKIKLAFSISENITNFYDIIFYRMGIKKKIKIKTKSGRVYVIDNEKDYKNFWGVFGFETIGLNNIDLSKEIINLNWKNKKISFYKSKHNDSVWGAFKDQFLDEQYKYLNVKDKTVVDIGANIGDSAMYFALCGAIKVYAFEPFPYIYNLSKKNIKINNLTEKILLINKAVGVPSKLKINEDYISAGGSTLKDFKKGKEIEVISLKNIIDKYNIPKHSSLKIDCEGSEYDIIKTYFFVFPI